MKIISIKNRTRIAATAGRLARQHGLKQVPLRGVTAAGATRGVALIPAHLRGEQANIVHAVFIVREA